MRTHTVLRQFANGESTEMTLEGFDRNIDDAAQIAVIEVDDKTTVWGIDNKTYIAVLLHFLTEPGRTIRFVGTFRRN